jgi:hypothetical protein
MRLRLMLSFVSIVSMIFYCWIWIVLFVFADSGAMAQSAAKVVILEPDSRATVSGQVGNDASFRRTFSIKLDGADSAKVRFVSSDLVTTSGNVIDRRQVSITGDSQLTREPHDYQVSVTGVTVAGEYSGIVQIIPENAPDGIDQLQVRLLAQPNVAVSLAQETTSFAVKLASPSDRLTCFVLGTSLCQRNHSVFLRAEGGALPAIEKLS